MIKKYGVYFFLVLLVLHCILIRVGTDAGRITTKLLIVPVLFLYLYASLPARKHLVSPVAPFVALFFSFMGDLFLTQTGERFFLLGMGAFIITHISNIVYFLQLQRFRVSKAVPALTALIIIGTAVFFVFGMMKDSLGAFKTPILVYMGIISLMGVLAANAISSGIYGRIAARWLVPGAGLFIISDAMLALDKFCFHAPAVWAVPVMLTYGLAQCLLVYGVVRQQNTGQA